MPTYPSPKSTLTPTSHVRKNCDFGEGWVVSYAENSKDSRSTLPKPLACKELEVVSDCPGLVDFAIRVSEW